MGKILTTLLMGVAATAAVAFTSVGAGTGIGGHATGVGQSDDGLTQVKASATYTGVLTGDGLQVVGECDAQGIGAVASTAIERCYLLIDGYEVDLLAQDVALPGNAVAVPVTKDVNEIPTALCVRAEARPVVGDPAPKTVCAYGALGVRPPHFTE